MVSVAVSVALVAAHAGGRNRAAELAVTVPADDRSILIAAAWLHDIGYAPGIQETGFHPLDGGLYLRRAGWMTDWLPWSCITPVHGLCLWNAASTR